MVFEERAYFLLSSLILAPLVQSLTLVSAVVFFLPVTLLIVPLAFMALGGFYTLRLRKVFKCILRGRLDNINLEATEKIDLRTLEHVRVRRTKGLPKLFYFKDLAVDLATGRIVWASPSLEGQGVTVGSLLHIHKEGSFPFLIPDIVDSHYWEDRKVLKAELHVKESSGAEMRRVTKTLRIGEAYQYSDLRKQLRRSRPLELGRLAVRKLEDDTLRST